MRRLTLLLCLIIGCHLALWSQGSYSFFKIEGNVKVKAEGIWRPAERRGKAHLRDQLQIAEGSRVGLLDEGSGRIFYSTTAGTYTVAKLIAEARKQSDHHLLEVNSRVTKAVSEQVQAGHSYAITGAIHRGEGADSQPMAKQTEALYEALLLKLSQHRERKRAVTVVHDVKLTWQRDSADDVLSPLIENQSKAPLYCTLLRRTSSGSLPVTVVTRFGKESGTPSLLVPPGQAAQVPGYLFAAEGHQPADWLLIASELPFDSQLLQQLIQRNAPTSTTPAILHLPK